MHEYSIVQALLDSCEDQASQHNCKSVTKVTVKIGVLSGVEPELLKSAFDMFKEDTICDSAEFVMNIQEVVIECNSCNENYTLKRREFLCPKCCSTDIKVIEGEDMFLMSLDME